MTQLHRVELNAFRFRFPYYDDRRERSYVHRAARRLDREIVRAAFDGSWPSDAEVFDELAAEDAAADLVWCETCGGECQGV